MLDEQSAIWQAVEAHDIRALDVLLRKGVDVNEIYNTKETLLSAATRHGDWEAVRALLSAGAEVDIVLCCHCEILGFHSSGEGLIIVV